MKTLSRFVSSDDERIERLIPSTAMPTGLHTVSLIAFKAGADVVSKSVTLAITVAAARLLATADFGVLALAMTTGWLLSVASDAGLPLYLAKRIARATAAGERLSFAPVLEVLRVRGVLGTIGSIVGLAVAVIVAPGATFFAFWLVVLAQILNAILETLAHAYRGLGRTDIESTILISQRLLTAAAAISVLLTTGSLLLLSVTLVVVPAVALMASVRTAHHVLGYEREPFADRTAIASGAPLSHARVGLAVLISALYFRCDVFFIERWHGLETVGVYNAAFRIVEALRLFPAAVLAVSFPALCTAGDLRLLRSLMAPLLATAMVAAGAVYVFAPFVLGTLYGARFVDGAPALATLALALPFFFGNYALTHQVIAWDAQGEYLSIVTAALATNIAGNLLLIPGRGMQGAAISTLVTEIVVAAGCLVVLARRRGRVAPVGADTSAGARS